MTSRERISEIGKKFSGRVAGKTCVLVLIAFLLAAGLFAPDTVYAVTCSISGPGTVNGVVGSALTFQFSASNNNSQSRMRITYTWTAEVPGISLSSYPAAGSAKSIIYTFSGTPTTSGNYSYTATAHDDAEKCTDVSTSGTVSIDNPPALQILTNTLPNGQSGTAYSAGLSGSGGELPYTWIATGLPAGLSISSATGSISGTPSGPAGEYTITITLNDNLTNITSKQFTINIAAAPTPLSITTLSLPSGQVNIPYSYTVTATGGTPGYTWSLTSGTLPSGLTLSSGGVISGTPTSANTYNATISVSDAAGGSANKSFAITISAAATAASSMTNYCITPPFTDQETLPNLLLMIDNSASMYDLSFVDNGSSTRSAYYCYDETFSSANSYSGYFNEAKIYYYNHDTFRFEEVSSFPASCDKKVPYTGSAASLCLKGNFTSKPYSMTDFYASGKYLNWLTASKFDVQKKVLTGGKYDQGNSALIAESRGCVGRRFLKEALKSDYAEGGTNESLGITFGIRGPLDPTNPSAPSQGGQTSIDIFVGDYDQNTCQTAIDFYQDPSCGQQCRREATAACIKYDSGNTSLDGKMSNTFIQAVQECYQFDLDGTVGPDAKNTVKNMCPDVLDGYPGPSTCSVTKTSSCTSDAECPEGERCKVGPYAIEPGNAALLCGSYYTGACYEGSTPYNKFGYTGTVDGRTGDDCITYMHNKFCNDIKQPSVVDPTDDPSATDQYANTPPILGDISVQSQLGAPIHSALVRIAASPSQGIIQDYKNRIRFGALTFNFSGSPAECKATDLFTDIVKCPRVCSNDKTRTCTSFQDCPSESPTPTCDLVSSSNMYTDPVTNQSRANQDGGHIISYLGDPTYAANPVGDHNSGLVRSLDDVRAQTWTPFAEGFYTAIAYYIQNTNTSDTTKPHRLNVTDFSTGIATAPNPIQNTCQRNHILMITDGMSTTDQKSDVMALVSTYNDSDGQVTTTASTSGSVAPKYFGSKNVDDLSWFAQNKNIYNPASTAALKNSQRIRTDVVYTGEPCANKATDGITCTDTSETIPERLMQQTAANGGGTYHLATNEAQFRSALAEIFEDIAGRAASGTAASVLASGEGSGANLIQAVFYPLRRFEDNTEVRWIGRLTNLWYYVDPRFSASGIYEDNASTNVLDLRTDYRVNLYYDAVAKKTMAHRVRDTNNNGVPDTAISPDINFEDLSSLWDAGLQLWKRDLGISPRRILTTIGSGLIDFSVAGKSTLRPYLQAANDTEAQNIINYAHGIDGAYRSRTVTINAHTTEAGTNTEVWKLGDVIQSTPRIASRFPLNTYDQTYNDTTYKTYIESSSYRNRGLVFAGANDGMLHAFYLGKLELEGTWKDSVYEKASLTDETNIGRGKEMWSFIPRNVLPYLKYLTDPNYCHIYSVDLTPVIFDAAIGAPSEGDISNDTKTSSSWRTILIGGMRLGGACRASDSTCTNCVKAPGVDLDGSGSVNTDAEKMLGMSSYFALDITATLDNPSQNPQLLWEFTVPDLGMTTSGPSIVKINIKSTDLDGDSILNGLDPSDKTKNGKYFVVFASGPTGSISTSDHQFKGESDQNLKLHIVDLKSGPTSGNYWVLDTNISEAFGGSILNASLDTDLDYQDDVVYVPYVKKCSSLLHPCTINTWTDGGVGRLLTHEDLNPARWTWSTVIDGTGPVTASVAKLLHQRKGALWLYFGTGRYFFEQDTPDDRSNQRRIYGVKDPCYSVGGFASSCGSAGSLTNVTNIADVPTDPLAIAAMNGWYINLDGVSSGYRAERVITDPLASTTGLVLFTTFQPKDDNCSPGGRSFLWATKYDTGGAGGALLKGKGLLQVSTGSIEEISLSQATFADGGGRKTNAMEGVPPTAQGLSLLSSPPPVKRTIHRKER